MDDIIKTELVWIHVKKSLPQEEIVFLIGGISKIDLGALVVRKGEYVWELVSRKKKTYAELSEYPYWTDVVAPVKEKDFPFTLLNIKQAPRPTSIKIDGEEFPVQSKIGHKRDGSIDECYLREG